MLRVVFLFLCLFLMAFIAVSFLPDVHDGC